MKLKFFYNVSLLLFVGYLFSSNSNGREGNWTGAPGDSGTCGTCHTTAGAGSIVLTGEPTTYDLGATYAMTLTLNDATAAVGGFQITATNGSNNALLGTFNPQAGQRLNGIGRLVQMSPPPAFSGGSVSFPISWTAPGAGTAPVRFYFSGNAANGNGGNGAGDMAYTGASALITLPVELTFFEGKAIDKQILLSWQTATEINSDYFEIERSIGATNKFEAIGRLEAAGSSNSRQDYEFWDENPTANQTLYYRLKQVDFDGTETYSKIQTVEMRFTEVTIYPNILTSGTPLTIDLEKEKEELYQIRMLNSLGQVVYANSTELIAGVNAIDVPNLTTGTYFLTIANRSELIATERIIVRN